MPQEYYITGYRFYTEKSINIPEDNWHEIKNAKLTISHLRYIEQKYDLMISNYHEFEKELLVQALDTSLRHIDTEGIHANYLSLARHIMNLLSSIVMYMEQVESRHIRELPLLKEDKKIILSRLNDLKSKDVNIWFAKNLRNYVMHRDLPLDSYHINSRWENIEGIPEAMEGHFIAPTIEKNQLLKDRAFKKEKDKLELIHDKRGRIDLRYTIKKTIAVLSEFNEGLRGSTEHHYKHAKKIILNTINRHNNLTGNKALYCNIVTLQGDEQIERHHLNEKHCNEIELFFKMNKNQGLLDRRYVHNRSNMVDLG